MQERDILLRICVLADVPTLRALSRTSLWDIMRQFIPTEYFWLLRTRVLMSGEIQVRPESHWKSTYYTLENCIEEDIRHPIRRIGDEEHREGRFTLRVIEDKIALLVLLEIGTVPNYTALDNAIEQGDIESTKVILFNLKNRTEHSDNYSLTLAAERGHVDLFSFLLEEMKTHSEYLIAYNESLESAVMSESVQMVNRVLEEDNVDPRADDYSAFKSAIELGDTQIASAILNDRRMDKIRHLYERDVQLMQVASSLENSSLRGH